MRRSRHDFAAGDHEPPLRSDLDRWSDEDGEGLVLEVEAVIQRFERDRRSFEHAAGEGFEGTVGANEDMAGVAQFGEHRVWSRSQLASRKHPIGLLH